MQIDTALPLRAFAIAIFAGFGFLESCLRGSWKGLCGVLCRAYAEFYAGAVSETILKGFMSVEPIGTREELLSFLKGRKIMEVECLVPDLAGMPRGKILPVEKFVAGLEGRGMRVPETVFQMSVTGSYSDEIADTSRDLFLIPDPKTARIVPWYHEDPTLQIICDAEFLDGSPTPIAPRGVLRHVLDAYEEMDIRPIVAPEIEFYLVDRNEDPDYPLRTPIGRTGRRDTSRQSLSVDGVNEYGEVLNTMFDYCEESRIEIDTLSHESGAGQIEVNFHHGDPMEMADQAFLFKRTLREAAYRKSIYATFMAKPMQHEPGSSMHIHTSLTDVKTGHNLFSSPKAGKETALFHHFLGGMQRHVLAAIPFMAPYVNSYRRLMPGLDAPINTHWGYDNRTVGFRIPLDKPQSRRVENRIAGSDVNPYLLIATNLACGLLGLREKRRARKPLESKKSAWDLQHQLPLTLYQALDRMTRDKAFREVMGDDFTRLYAIVKEDEMDEFQKVISPWERENLLLSV